MNTNDKQTIDDNSLISTNNNKEDLSSSLSTNDVTIVHDTVPNWTQSGGQVRMNNIRFSRIISFYFKDLRATPDMKTDKQDSVSATNSSATTTSRIASSGAVVCFDLLICKDDK